MTRQPPAPAEPSRPPTLLGVLLCALLMGGCAAEDFNGDAVVIERLRSGCRAHMKTAITHADSVAVLKYQIWYGGSAYPECSLWLNDSTKVKP